MSDRAVQYPTQRPTRRHERRDGHDIADIYEARLLAQGMRSDDFLALRSSIDVPPIPDIKPFRFGRGVEPAVLLPIAAESAEPVPDKADDGEVDDAVTETASSESD